MATKPSAVIDTRVIYCGDNLDQLRKLSAACVDLIYIDPPFNSNRNYEVFWGETKEKRSFEDRHASTQAYIDYMRPRCIELHRVLKKTGSFYYHCDWHASHYVKIMLDQIFGENQFVNEIIWKRQSAHSDAKQGSRHLGRLHDAILLYAKGEKYTFNHVYQPYSEEYIEDFYRYTEPSTGRQYRLGDLTAPGGGAPSKGNPHYEFLGVKRYWRYSKENMEKLYREGRVVQTKPGAVPQYKRYLDEGKGVQLGSVWDDINPLHGSDAERLGYPTQKPLKLLERILQIGSNENDIVLCILRLRNRARRRAETKAPMDRDRHLSDGVPRNGATAEERLRTQRRRNAATDRTRLRRPRLAEDRRRTAQISAV